MHLLITWQRNIALMPVAFMLLEQAWAVELPGILPVTSAARLQQSFQLAELRLQWISVVLTSPVRKLRYGRSITTEIKLLLLQFHNNSLTRLIAIMQILLLSLQAFQAKIMMPGQKPLILVTGKMV